MNSQLRREYLDALGLRSWTLRGKPGLAGAPAPAVTAAIAEPPMRGTATSVSEVSATREAGADWDELRARVAACTRCSLSSTRTQTVFGVGNPHADWLIVGEAPGAEEDRRGEPFVGRAGQLLNNMIKAMGLRREDVYIANIIKCRPPGNRTPERDECET